MMDFLGMKSNHPYKVTPPYKPRRSLLSSTPMKFGMEGELKGIEPAAKRLKIQFEKSDFATTPIKINSDDVHCGAGIEVEIVSEYSEPQQNEVKKLFYLVKTQIQCHRALDTRINKTDIHFWAVLGSQGCREKTSKLP